MNLQKYTLVVAGLIFSLLTYSCKDRYTVEVPTYIHIDSFEFVERNIDSTGGGGHSIGAVWVYLDNELVGAFDLPATVPLLIKDKGIVSFAPSVSFNGLNSIQSAYSFYTLDTLTVAANPGEKVHYIPKTRYASLKYPLPFVENFNGRNNFVNYNDDVPIVQKDNYGYIYLHGDSLTSYNVSNADAVGSWFEADLSKEYFIEFDFKCSIPFQIGLAGLLKNGNMYYEYFAGVRPSPDKWKHMYVSAIDFIRGNSPIKNMLIVAASIDGEETTEGWVMIDNIKVVTRD